MSKRIPSCLLILGAFIIVSCAKKSDSDSARIVANGTFAGSWEIRELIGCQVPNCNPYFEKGNGTGWSFTDTSYNYYRNNQLQASGKLETGKDISPATGKLMDYFIMRDNINNMYSLDKIFFEIKSDTLYLYRGVLAADGTIEKYVPAQNFAQ